MREVSSRTDSDQMSPVYTFDRTALLKILLHAAKYPASSVNGILLADTKKGKSAADSVTVVDAIPVLHSFLTLAPVLETALIQVFSGAKQKTTPTYFKLAYVPSLQIQSFAKQKGLQLIGYYHANERFDDTELGPSARKIADKLYANNSLSCAVLVGLLACAHSLYQ